MNINKKSIDLEEIWPLLLESISDLIVIIDQDYFKISFLNDQAFLNVLGFEGKELIGQSILDFIHPDEFGNFIKALNKVQLIDSEQQIKEQGSKLKEIRIKNSNCEFKWFELKIKKFKDSFLIFLKDITKSKELDKLKDIDRKIVENIEEGYFEVDLNGNFTFFNDSMCEILGYSSEELLGLNYRKYMTKDNSERIFDVFNSVFSLGKAHKNIHYKLIRKDNQIIYGESSVYLRTDSKGNKIGFSGFLLDVSEKVEAEKRLKRSEEKFRTITEQSLMGIIEYDVKKKDITYANPKILSILGYEADNNLGKKKYFEQIHPDDIKKFYKFKDKTDLVFRIYDKTGKIKWLNGHRVNHFNENGELLSFRLWLEDVTEKKGYETLIYELNINFLNFTTDIKGNIKMLIETCRKLLNAEIVLYSYKEHKEGKMQYKIITSNYNKVFTFEPEEFKKNLIISELFDEEHDFTQTFIDIPETRFAKTDQFIIDSKTIGCVGKLIKSEDEFNSGICVFFKQNPIISHQNFLVLFLICDAIEIEKRRWEVLQFLEEQNKFKTYLLSRTSHELKTPLISIKGFTELLLTNHCSKLDTEMVSVLEEIKEGSRRLEELINSLLKSSSLDQDQMKLKKTSEDLSFLIKFCVKELQGLAKMRNQKINLNLHEYLTADFDKERMYDVIANILINSIKYTHPGGVITIQTEVKEKFYVVSIKDNGIGITKDEKGQLFKQFGKIERYGRGWNVDIEGSGLGLYIAKKIVELHGGKIWIESEGRNKGTTFLFSIPII